jgi:predicted phosphodiesterase
LTFRAGWNGLEKYMTRIVVISDTHMHEPEIPSGDLLLHAGDFTMSGSRKETEKALAWFGKTAKSFQHALCIGGNHDFFLYHLSNELGPQAVRDFVFKHAAPNVIYLENELWATELEGKVFSVYGSPAQPEFGGMAWNKERGPEIRAVWDNIPTLGVDVLMTHGPAYHVLDWVGRDRVGCQDLRDALDRVQPKVHAFGHIHAGYGKAQTFAQGGRTTQCYNASVVGEDYKLNPKHKPWVLDYNGENFVEAK